MRNKIGIVVFLTLCLLVSWAQKVHAQNFPYHVSVEVVSGHCFDDSHLIFTLSDDNGNEIQINPQTHNAMNTAQYPLYNVRYHYQNSTGGLDVQYDYNHDILLVAGTYNVGVTASFMQNGVSTEVDTTLNNVQVTTMYAPLDVHALANLAAGTADGHEIFGYHPSFHCADLGRIQLQITQGNFPYEVTILDEQQDTVRHTLFYQRVNSGTYYRYADYRDYYTFDNLPIGTYSILVSDSCGYEQSFSFEKPDAEPTYYNVYVDVKNSECPDETVIPFNLSMTAPLTLHNYTHLYFDSIFRYRFLNPGGDTTAWIIFTPYSWYDGWNEVYDTLPNYCVLFNDTVTVQIQDLCRDTLMNFCFKFLPQFNLMDSVVMVNFADSIIHDTCATFLQSGVYTQSYMFAGEQPFVWDNSGHSLGGGTLVNPKKVPFRYYRCPLSYNIWSLPDSTLLGHSELDEFTGVGADTWMAFNVDTSVSVHMSVTDDQGCLLTEKDTVLVYQTEPVDSLSFWFECHSDQDDDGKSHCCEERYLWIQEHGVVADTFRRNMTIRLMDSPLYDWLNFTAVRQDGEWTVTQDNQDNQSTYVEFSYDDGWRATVRDSRCLPPGRYVFEVTTDCGVDTITYTSSGYFWDTIAFTSSPQYEMQQVCDQVVVTQVSDGLESYVYLIDPEVSNDVPIQEACPHVTSSYSPSGISSTKNDQGQFVYVFSLPGTYNIVTYSTNNAHNYNTMGWCSPTSYQTDTITIEFSSLGFAMAVAKLCNPLSGSGIVTVQAVHGTPPYTYTLYDQGNATGNVIASNTTGFFDNLSMTAGQQFSVKIMDSCSTSFNVNLTAVNATETILYDTVCQGTGYTWNDTTYYESGAYTRHFAVENGCDSVVTLLLTVTNTPSVSVSATADTLCYGDSVTLQASASPVVALPPVAVGDILCTDGTTVKPASFPSSGKTAKGVVFYVDTTGVHGWAVHLQDQSTSVKWSLTSNDVPGVSNIENFHSIGLFPDFAGSANTQGLLAYANGNANLYPAVHMIDVANGWYMPDIGQLSVLFSELVVVNASLAEVNGDVFPMDISWKYWSSTEAANSDSYCAWAVDNEGKVDYFSKDNNYRLRSIRDF